MCKLTTNISTSYFGLKVLLPQWTNTHRPMDLVLLRFQKQNYSTIPGELGSPSLKLGTWWPASVCANLSQYVIIYYMQVEALKTILLSSVVYTHARCY